jgi:small GTP-binding protein
MDQSNHNLDEVQLCKIILVGDANVGKTHILNRYIKGTLPKHNVPTIGVEFATRVVELQNGVKVKAQIWDTAGQERYRAITSAHYRKALGALVVYDVTKEKTFDSVQRWVEELKYHAEPDIVIVLVGNKVDLVEKNPSLRKVSRESAQRLAEDHNMTFEETSAITSENVNDVFERLLKDVLRTKHHNRGRDASVILTKNGGNKNEGCC